MPHIANVSVQYPDALPPDYEKVVEGVALHYGLTARRVRETPDGVGFQLTDEDFTLKRNASFEECVKMIHDEVPKSLARKRPMPTRSKPSSDPKRMAALIRSQIADVERIKSLDFEHPDVFKWESDTIAVLRPLGKDGDFRALSETEEFSKFQELWATDTEGDDVKHRRLRDKQRALLESVIFELENVLGPAHPSGYTFHSKIESVSGQLMRDGHYREAALNAYMAVIGKVQKTTGLQNRDLQPMEGEALMRRAFDCTNNKVPVARFNDLQNRTDRDEQQGLAYLYIGLALLRNSKAHEIRALGDPNRAYEYLALASLLIRLLEIAVIALPEGADAPSQAGSRNPEA